MFFGCCCKRRWYFQHRKRITRRALCPGPSHRVLPSPAFRGREAGWARLGRAPAWCEANIGAGVLRFVREEAAFDEPYNTRLHPTHGTRSRVPRVPALRCVVTPRGAGEPERWADRANDVIPD